MITAKNMIYTAVKQRPKRPARFLLTAHHADRTPHPPSTRTPRPAVRTPRPAVRTPRPADRTPRPAVHTPCPAVHTLCAALSTVNSTISEKIRKSERQATDAQGFGQSRMKILPAPKLTCKAELRNIKARPSGRRVLLLLMYCNCDFVPKFRSFALLRVRRLSRSGTLA